MDKDMIELIASLLVGLAFAIPLVSSLVKWVKKAIKEKNWGALMGLLVTLISEAEGLFATGAERKEWVMKMCKASAEYLKYPFDEDTLSDMIDALVAMSKVVNVAPKE